MALTTGYRVIKAEAHDAVDAFLQVHRAEVT